MPAYEPTETLEAAASAGPLPGIAVARTVIDGKVHYAQTVFDGTSHRWAVNGGLHPTVVGTLLPVGTLFTQVVE